MSTRYLAYIFLSVLLLAVPLSARSAAPQSEPGANRAKLVYTFDGVVSAIHMGVSHEHPCVTLTLASGKAITILTGPYYYLIENGFEIEVGHQMSVQVFPSLWFDDVYVALTLSNLTTGEALAVRGDDGHPLWPRRGGPGTGGMGYCYECGSSSPTLTNLAGVVLSVDMGFSLEHPSFSILLDSGEKVTILVGPYRYLVENGFALHAGDRVSVTAMRSQWPDSVYLAFEIENLTTSESILLRDLDGAPLWVPGGGPGGPGGPGGNRMGDCSGWIAPSGRLDVVTLAGTIVGVAMAPGQEFPNITLALADGTEVVVVTGPYHLLLTSGFVLRVGDKLEADAYASAWYVDTYIAIVIKNLTTGESLELRSDSGMPLWSGNEDIGDYGVGYGGGAAWFDSEKEEVVIKGRVQNTELRFGDAMEVVTLVKPNGRRYTLLLGPHHFMLGQDFQIRDRDRLRVRARESRWFEGLYVVDFVKNRRTKRTLMLRDETGRPMWDALGQ